MQFGTMVHFETGNLDVEEKFRRLQQHGIPTCQLCSWTPEVFTPEHAERIARAASAYGIRISAFWCGYEGPRVWNFYEGQRTLGLVPEEWRAVRVKNLCDGADFARWIGENEHYPFSPIRDIVTHIGFIPENPYDLAFMPLCEAIRTVADHLAASGQVLLFETGQETPVTLLRCFETVGRPNLGVNIDTANLILYGKANPVDALDILGPHIRGVHAKDGLYPVNGHELGREVPIGEGKVDFPAFFRRLKEFGYDGAVTIEREIGNPDELDAIIAAKDYLKEDMTDENYGC